MQKIINKSLATCYICNKKYTLDDIQHGNIEIIGVCKNPICNLLNRIKSAQEINAKKISNLEKEVSSLEDLKWLKEEVVSFYEKIKLIIE